MSELISGKDSKLAWANGENIEAQYKKYESENCWFLITDSDQLYVFDRQDLNFRLKPRTITLNGIEVPSVKYVAHSGGYCVKISCECPEDAAAISAALRSVFGKK